MSRIGKKIIELPTGVTCTFDKTTNTVTVKGPLGQLQQTLPDFVNVVSENNTVVVSVVNPNNSKQVAMWGTARALINTKVVGVSEGFTNSLELNGVGFKMDIVGDELVMALGFSHPVKLTIPSEIKLSIVKNLLSGSSIDKQFLNNFFTGLHNKKPCDVYKHKGFKFPGRYYIKKVGKKNTK